MGKTGWEWFPGTEDQIRFLANSSWVLLPWLRAGHSWRDDNPEAREGLSRPRLSIAYILGAENSDECRAGAPCLFWDEAEDRYCRENPQNEDSRESFRVVQRTKMALLMAKGHNSWPTPPLATTPPN